MTGLCILWARAWAAWYPAFNIPDDAKRRMKKGIKDVMGMRISDDFDKAAASLDPVAVQEGFDKPVLINPMQCGLGICCGCDR